MLLEQVGNDMEKNEPHLLPCIYIKINLKFIINLNLQIKQQNS